MDKIWLRIPGSRVLAPIFCGIYGPIDFGKLLFTNWYAPTTDSPDLFSTQPPLVPCWNHQSKTALTLVPSASKEVASLFSGNVFCKDLQLSTYKGLTQREYLQVALTMP
jgi:hypothetical protein